MYRRGSRRYGVCLMCRLGADWMEYNVNIGEYWRNEAGRVMICSIIVCSKVGMYHEIFIIHPYKLIKGIFCIKVYYIVHFLRIFKRNASDFVIPQNTTNG